MKMSSVRSELAMSTLTSLPHSSVAHASGRHSCRTVVLQQLVGIEGVRTLCHAENIIYQGFSLISGNRSLLQTPYVQSIAKRHGKTAEQLIYRFAIQLGIVPLTGTTNGAHMREALDVLDFILRRRIWIFYLSYAAPGS